MPEAHIADQLRSLCSAKCVLSYLGLWSTNRHRVLEMVTNAARQYSFNTIPAAELPLPKVPPSLRALPVWHEIVRRHK